MRLITFIVILFCGTYLSAQYRWDYGFDLGASNYLGDIGGKEKARRNFVSDMKMAETRWNMGGFARYKFSHLLAVKMDLSYLRIQGDDKLSSNPGRHARNLNFRNDIFSLEVTPQFTLYENQDIGSNYRFRTAFKLYAFAGVGVFHHNPKASFMGDWVPLQPLHTEGVNYSLWQFDVPMGGGFYFTFKKRYRFGFEYSWRKCFTDYLDDISGNYVNPNTLSSLGAKLANRTGELPAGAEPASTLSYFKPGAKRGDPSHKDNFMTASLNYSYVIRGKSYFYRSRYGSFFFKKTRRKARKIRAKF